MGFNLTCNSTLEDMRIENEKPILGPLTFHELALIVGGGCTLIAILLSFYLMWMHALNYTKPREQRQIIRILLMVPMYAGSAFLQIYYYYHAIYFQVISDCYEAFAIASFFTLMCHYMAPDLHEQKNYFRDMRPIKPWVWPLDWFAACCGGQRGIWRTPKSGLTWFNIIWIGIYHYCFVRVAMTITAVVTQYFNRYCESSNSPVFAHIWVLTINSLAVTVAMYCVIQFYVQLREPLAEHKPFLKVLSIKLVIFLICWQMMAISLGTSTLEIVQPNDAIAYPDLKVGVNALLICFEMSIFAVMHLWAFPYQPYKPGAKQTFYPVPDPDAPGAAPPRANVHTAPAGGALGFGAFVDALNLWDVVKAFGRGVRWLFWGVKTRKDDPSYQDGSKEGGVELRKTSSEEAYDYAPGQKSTDHLPIATEFRRSTFAIPGGSANPGARRLGAGGGEESAGLIAHAQASPSGGNALLGGGGGVSRQWSSTHGSGYSSPIPPPSPYRDSRPPMEAYREEGYEDALAREQQLEDQQRQQQYRGRSQSQEQGQGRRIAGDGRGIQQQQQQQQPAPPRPRGDDGHGEIGLALWGGEGQAGRI